MFWIAANKFRADAGLKPKAKHYEGWESQGIAGHSLGHYLSACAQMYAATGERKFKERADYSVAELKACQKARPDGRLTAFAEADRIFAEIARGEIRSQGFDLNGSWVPWYTLHKLFAGLLDAHQWCQNMEALDIAEKLADWAIDVTANLDDLAGS